MGAADCRICGNVEDNKVHHAREMMFGTGEPFTYVECADCGTVQLQEQPAEMSRHYPDEYYSAVHSAAARRGSRSLRKLRTELALRAPRRLARLPKLNPGVRPMWFHGRARTDSRILDVGCGAGQALHDLWEAGFDQLVGHDPFFSAAADAPFLVHQDKPDWFRQHFDVVMMHHALEHVPDPVAQLVELVTMLAPQGGILIRVPLADSWAWKHYGVSWVQLDPPRHFWLMTDRSIDIVAAKAGLRVVERWRDSTAFQFWGSELFASNRPLHGSAPPPDTRAMAARAADLNRSGEGDQGGYWLERRDLGRTPGGVVGSLG